MKTILRVGLALSLAVGSSIGLVGPAHAAPTQLPVLSYLGTTVQVDKQVIWGGFRSDWASSFLFVCSDAKLAEVVQDQDYFGCTFISSATLGAPLPNFDTGSGQIAGVNYSQQTHGNNFVYLSVYWSSDGVAVPSNPVMFAAGAVLDITVASPPQPSPPEPSPPEPSSEDVVREIPAPFDGPVLNTPAITSSVAAGGKVVIPGSNLAGVSSVEIGGVSATVVVNSAGELEITIPAGLAAGTYDLVVLSSSGRLTIQNAITVSGSSANSGSGDATVSTKRMGDGTAKVWVFDVVGAGKVQIFVNGKEIAWVNANDANDSKLFNGYLVRTVELAEGKSVIEVFVDGERERRTVYSN